MPRGVVGILCGQNSGLPRQQALGIGRPDRGKLRVSENGLLQLQERRFKIKKRGVRAENDAVSGHLFEEVGDAADAFGRGDIEIDLASLSELGQELAIDRAEPVQQHDAHVGARGQQTKEWGDIDVRHADKRMLGALIFHAQGQLDRQAAGLGEVEDLCKPRVVQSIAVIVWIKPKTRHLELLVATADILLPVGELRVERAKRDEQAMSMAAALFEQVRIDCADILMKQRIEAPSAGPGDTVAAEPRHELGCFIEREAAERPAGQGDVEID